MRPHSLFKVILHQRAGGFLFKRGLSVWSSWTRKNRFTTEQKYRGSTFSQTDTSTVLSVVPLSTSSQRTLVVGPQSMITHVSEVELSGKGFGMAIIILQLEPSMKLDKQLHLKVDTTT